MMNAVANKFFTALLLCVVGCIHAHALDESELRADLPSDTDIPQPIVTLVEGFNNADVEKMGEALSEDCEVLYVDTQGESVVGSNDRSTLQQQMRGYFESINDVQSELSDVVIVGRYVTARETVSWQVEGNRQSQYSLVVFELESSQSAIKRVWYYPAQRN